MKILDSDILIAILRGDKSAETIVDSLDEEGKAATTVINSYEILFGAKRSYKKEENLKETRRLLAKLNVLDMDVEASEISSSLHAQLLENGNMINLRDIFIASIILANGYNTIITRNIKDFSKIKELRIEKW
ncbi:MAG: type II toxin-antitoxin system VapC family toxin [Candidatus Aenigmarchaeota archaeon]|nr:type II toxin-antitoxin system VapC family toxin [Candidatus Aenigmarchaeota archaeon]